MVIFYSGLWRKIRTVFETEADALERYLLNTWGENMPVDRHRLVIRWARLRLPNGQVARSAWREKLKPLEKLRTARNVKVCSITFVSLSFIHPPT